MESEVKADVWYILTHTILPQPAASLDTWQLIVIMVLLAFCSLLSVLGCLFIMVGFTVTKSLNLTQNRLVFYLSIADLIKSIGNLLIPANAVFVYYYPQYANPACQIQGFFEEFTISSFFWTAMIATYSLLKAGFGLKHVAVWFEPIAHVVGWVLPLAICFWLLLSGQYGPAGYWCWITNEFCGMCDPTDLQCLLTDNDAGYKADWHAWSLGLLPQLEVPCIPSGIVSRWGLFYGPLIMIMVYIVVVYSSIGIKIYISYRRSGASGMSTGRKRSFYRLFLYCFALIICRTPSLLQRGEETVIRGYEIYLFFLLHGVGASIQGFMNAIIYGAHEGLLLRIKNACSKNGRSNTYVAQRSEQADFRRGLSILSEGGNPQAGALEEMLLGVSYTKDNDSDSDEENSRLSKLYRDMEEIMAESTT
jgi:hypothetical protein